MPCPCGNSLSLQECCEPFIKRKKLPETAEQLMRSRYTAYTLHEMKYLTETLAPEARADFDAEETKKWAEQAIWKKLEILDTKKGKAGDSQGVVEFSAFYEHNGEDLQHHEVSTFRKDKDGQWLFVDGNAHTHPADEDLEKAHATPVTVVRESAKIGRNDPCSCGSGKKYKKCCG